MHMAISEDDETALAERLAVMRQVLTERQWRVCLGAEANALGHGGIAAVARVSGASPVTVAAGAAEARDPQALAALDPGRSRRAGAGRPKAEDAQPGLRQELDKVLEAGRRGDPMRAICWNVLSLRTIARKMAAAGFAVKRNALSRLMREAGYSLQGMSRVKEGKQHPDRDAQFTVINDLIGLFTLLGLPVISCDTKKKELIGEYWRDGKTWQPAGQPVQVRDHDFADQDTVQIAPYGIYDIAANTGFVSVGTSHDTGAFAVNAIRLWWRHQGRLRYPDAECLLVTVDAGGSNGHRCRLWRRELAKLAEETGLTIFVLHFPPGTSKWNKVEHRLFCHLTRTWSQSPLLTLEDALNGITATTTVTGLAVTAVRDDSDYPTGVQVSDQEIRDVEARWIDRGPENDTLSYAVLPQPRPAPEPGPGPERPGRVPAAVLNHPALTGIQPGDMTSLAAALDLPFEARLAQRNHVLRKGPRVNNVRSTAVNAKRALTIVDHLLALRLRDHLGLPAAAIGALLGVDRTTITHATTLARELLAAARTELPAAPPPETVPRTPAGLLAYAADAGIPLTIPENRHAMPERFITRNNRPAMPRPKPSTK
jgi:predicted DNA-binding protein (UPF0251 family)